MVSSKDEPYRSLHGLPWPAVEAPAMPHWTIELMKTPLSLPPMVIVTSSVSARTRVELRGDAVVLRGEVVTGVRPAAGHVGELRAGRRGDEVGVVAGRPQALRRRRRVGREDAGGGAVGVAERDVPERRRVAWDDGAPSRTNSRAARTHAARRCTGFSIGSPEPTDGYNGRRRRRLRP